MSFADRYGIGPDPNTTRFADSDAAGWTSVYVARFRHSGVAEPFETAATPHQKFSVITKNSLELGTRRNGRWPTARRQAGSIGLTPPGSTKHLRWRAVNGSFETAQLYVPAATFAGAADEYRRIGARPRSEPLTESGFSDPLITSVIGSIIAAASAGAPELYAESASRFLAMHVMRLQAESAPAKDDRKPGTLADRRLSNVIAFMQAHYMRPLSIDQLAREAGVSPYHFAHLFKTATGAPPHRFLTQIRLRAAASMLRYTDKSVLDIALSCGFYATSHFSDAFRRNFGKTPTQFRTDCNS